MTFEKETGNMQASRAESFMEPIVWKEDATMICLCSLVRRSSIDDKTSKGKSSDKDLLSPIDHKINPIHRATPP